MHNAAMLRINYTQTGVPLEAVQQRIGQAQAKALRGLAFDVRDAIRAKMGSVFDKPSAFTLNAFRVDASQAAGGEVVVWAMPRQAQYLRWQIEGGERGSKAFEHKMGLFGGRVAVPVGKYNAQFDRNPKGFVARVLADMNTGGTAKRFFAGTPRGMTGDAGIWARVNNNKRLVSVMRFADDAQYAERLDLSAIAGETVTAKWESQLLRNIARQ